jgi:hypothetical protein
MAEGYNTQFTPEQQQEIDKLETDAYASDGGMDGAEIEEINKKKEEFLKENNGGELPPPAAPDGATMGVMGPPAGAGESAPPKA